MGLGTVSVPQGCRPPSPQTRWRKTTETCSHHTSGGLEPKTEEGSGPGSPGRSQRGAPPRPSQLLGPQEPLGVWLRGSNVCLCLAMASCVHLASRSFSLRGSFTASAKPLLPSKLTFPGTGSRDRDPSVGDHRETHRRPLSAASAGSRGGAPWSGAAETPCALGFPLERPR